MNLLNVDNAGITYFSYVKRDSTFRIQDGDHPMSILDLTLCIEGQMQYLYNGEHITLNAGDGILIVPGSYRERYETNIPTLYASINLYFNSEENFEIEGHLPGVVNSDILYLLDMFKKEFSTFSSRKDEKCLSIFNYIYNRIYETVCDKENPHVKAIKQYVSDNLSEDLSLATLAAHVHLAPQYVCTLFKKETGMTITQFILKSRIDYAKMLISATNASILEIAEGCGFVDYCYFSHTFKKITGVSARQYRANLKK